jgi:hypothetical protein
MLKQCKHVGTIFEFLIKIISKLEDLNQIKIQKN